MRKCLGAPRLGFLALVAAGAVALAAPAAMAAASAAPAAAVKSVDSRLDGVWTITSAGRQMAPYKDVEGSTVTIKGDTFKVDRPGHSGWSGHISANSKTGKIDFMHEADTLLPPLAGDKWQGIYKFDGPLLVINTAQAHDARPTEFISGYDLALFQLEKK